MLNRNLLRPLALAAVGCLLVVSLAGCSSKEDSSSSDASSAASSAASVSASSETADSAEPSSQENGEADSGAASGEASSGAAEAASGNAAEGGTRSDAGEESKGEPAASSKTEHTAASASSKHEAASSSSGNAECDAKIAELTNELYSLQASAQAAISSALEAAKEEFHALPEDQQTDTRKYNIAYSHLSSAQSEYDRKVASVIRQMRRVLNDYDQPQTVADEAESYYESSKEAMISKLS